MAVRQREDAGAAADPDQHVPARIDDDHAGVDREGRRAAGGRLLVRRRGECDRPCQCSNLDPPGYQRKIGRMAKQTFTKIVDDISGEEDAATYTFSLNGAQYSIDLAEKMCSSPVASS